MYISRVRSNINIPSGNYRGLKFYTRKRTIIDSETGIFRIDSNGTPCRTVRGKSVEGTILEGKTVV
jgi:hypothetical protein